MENITRNDKLFNLFSPITKFLGLFTLFEAKTGHQKFPWSNGRAFGDREQQFAKQLSVALYCGYDYFIAVDNLEGTNALKGAFPTMPIFHIPIGGGEYR